VCLCLSQSSQDYNQTGILQCASLQKVDQQLQSIKQQVDICKLFVMAERTGNGICKHKIYYQSQGHSQELAMGGGTKEVVWALGASGSRGKAPVFECKAPRSRKQMLISRYDGGACTRVPLATPLISPSWTRFYYQSAHCTVDLGSNPACAIFITPNLAYSAI